MRRRTFLTLGVGAVGAALAAPYVALAPGDEFEELVASTLGIEPELAGQLLEGVRKDYGAAEYDLRALAFGLAVRDPAAALVTKGFRRSAIQGLLEPMLSTPAATVAYAITGSDPGAAACAGLVRSR